MESLSLQKYKKWELSYGGRDKFYLNDKERLAFLKEIYGGAEVVQVGDYTLSKFFRYLIPVVDQKEPTDYKNMVQMISEEQRLKNIETITKIKSVLKTHVSLPKKKEYYKVMSDVNKPST